MTTYSIYHQKAGSRGWDLKESFDSKEEAIEELKRWATLDLRDDATNEDFEEIEKIDNSYSYDQNYYRIVASTEDYLTNSEI